MIQDLNEARTVVIKVGTASLTTETGDLDIEMLSSLVDDVAELWRDGRNITIITSGAVAMGRKGDGGDVRTAAMRGQPRLMHSYYELFQRHGIEIGQLLLTNDQFEIKSKKRTVRNVEGAERFVHAVSEAFHERTVVIINENDPITTIETTLGDNDNLASKTARYLKADLLIIMSMKDGQQRGRGGKDAKLNAIREVEGAGIRVLVVEGKSRHILKRVFEGDRSGHLNVQTIKDAARIDQNLTRMKMRG